MAILTSKFVRGVLVVALSVACAISFHLATRLWRVWAPSGAAELPDVSVDVPQPAGPRKFEERYWVHRVDSIERARAIQTAATGIEIDVVFDSRTASFDVGHPPVPSIGLSLERLIEALDRPDAHYYWLDFKNLSADNQSESLEVLDKLTKRFKIRDRIIVESASPQFLPAFSARGYYTSYYLPVGDPYELSPVELEQLVRTIAHGMRAGGISALSSDALNYEFIRKYFPAYDILLWYPTRNWLVYEIRKARVMPDPQVKVMLFHHASVGYR